MGLGKWINRYIVEIEPQPGEAEPPASDAEPAQLAEAARLVPSERTAEAVLEDVEPPRFSDEQFDPGLSDAPTPSPEESKRLRAAAAAAAAVSLQPPAAVEDADAAPERDPLDDGEPPPIDVPQVYAAAKIGPPLHGFSLEKIAGMLGDARMAALPREARASAIAVLLETAGVHIDDVVKDAAQRDQALDRFEDFLAEKLIDLEVEIDKENAALEAEIERLIARKQAQREANEAKVQAKRVELARFRRVKRAEERRLFDVVAYFTAENPVDVTPVQRDPGSG
ncbi:MAG: hypothetical protein KDD82_09860 [Planctomycetes bacterium]|nr:hypothetical protein [Planctomycetota bacterium]